LGDPPPTDSAFLLLIRVIPTDLHDLKEDLHKVIKEEITASEKRMKEYIDLKIETMNARIDAIRVNR
jgi:hypothetical protein